MDNNATSYICKKCNVDKPLDQYYKNRRICKICVCDNIKLNYKNGYNLVIKQNKQNRYKIDQITPSLAYNAVKHNRKVHELLDIIVNDYKDRGKMEYLQEYLINLGINELFIGPTN